MLSLVKKQSIFPYYHIINDVNVKHIKHLYQFKNVQQFEKDIDILLQHYKPLNPEIFINSSEKMKIPKNHFLLTFDDGLSEVFDIIAPILKKNNISGIFFINPNFIDNKNSLFKHDISIIIDTLKSSKHSEDSLTKIKRLLNIESTSSLDQLISSIKKTKHADKGVLKTIANILDVDIPYYINNQKPYLSKSAIKEMMNMGFYFGGHTMSHPRLAELDLEEQTEEVINSIHWLKSNFGIDYSFFAFPFWDKGVSKKLIERIFQYDDKAFVFGNSGIKKDIHSRIIQRFSLEDPSKETEKRIVTENLYKFYNKVIGKYKIRRN